MGQLWKLREKMHLVKLTLYPPLKKKVCNVVLANYFFCCPFPQAMLSLLKMTLNTWCQHCIGGRGRGKIRHFYGLLPLCPKSSGQGCRSSAHKPKEFVCFCTLLKYLFFWGEIAWHPHTVGFLCIGDKSLLETVGITMWHSKGPWASEIVFRIHSGR